MADLCLLVIRINLPVQQYSDGCPLLYSDQAFLEGFWQLVPRELIAIFNDHELELLISGLPDIDVADLRANSEYTGYSAASPVIQWFWQVVADMEKQDLALMLQFVTGAVSKCILTQREELVE